VATPGLEQSDGWWNRIVAGDFFGHGHVDFIVGNVGLNTRCRAGPTLPVTMYVKDFAHTGFAQQIVSCFNGDTSYPVAQRDELLSAIPGLKTKYLTYKEYARQTVTDIFSADELKG